MKKTNRYLTLEERKIIETMLHNKCKHIEIIEKLKIHTTTLYREFKRCAESYNAEEAHATVYRSQNLIDFGIIGKRFGLLTVIEYANTYKNRSWWKCRCDCGKECIVNRKKFQDYCSPKRPLSCGCIAKQQKYRTHKVPIEEACLAKYQDMLRFRKIQGDCWIWMGYRQKGKCPKTSFKCKSMSVRRCMYMLSNGLDHLDEKVHTTCGNLFCFNPEHLTLETPLKRHLYQDCEEY